MRKGLIDISLETLRDLITELVQKELDPNLLDLIYKILLHESL